MKAKELKEVLKNINDEAEIRGYVYDYEYDSENPQDLGSAEIIGLEFDKYGNYIVVGINR